MARRRHFGHTPRVAAPGKGRLEKGQQTIACDLWPGRARAKGKNVRVVVLHDFTADPADVPPESAFAAQMAGAGTPTPEELEVGHRLGAQVVK